MVLEQLRVGFDNFSYVLHCPIHKKAAIVDPGFDAKKLMQFLKENRYSLDFVILTHYHSDHTAELPYLKKMYPTAQVVASKDDGQRLPVPPDVVVSDGSRLLLGTIRLSFLLTPGHTPGGICIIVNDEALLTGDTLFIGDCGRTNLAGGSLEEMFRSLQEKIIPLSDELVVYPGHDYGDMPFDTLGHQKRTNKTLLAKNLKEFSLIP